MINLDVAQEDKAQMYWKNSRDEYEDDHYYTLIDCPVHLTHKVKLFTYEHEFGGIWECNETIDSYSDLCPHFDSVSEEIEDEYGNSVLIQVCVLDGVALEDSDDDFRV